VRQQQRTHGLPALARQLQVLLQDALATRSAMTTATRRQLDVDATSIQIRVMQLQRVLLEVEI
jgi:hypothetical protein